MKKLSTILFTFAFALPAVANVDPKIAEFCLKAQDFQGCVNSMTGKQSDRSTTIRQIQQQGADIAEGNQCPAAMAYRGGGICQEVICAEKGMWFVGPHNPLLAGKTWRCTGGGIGSPGRLDWGTATARASQNPNCPAGQIEIGYNSTCDKPPAGWESPAAKAAREEREGPRCDFKLKAYNCSYDAYLDANPGMKKWAELNPELSKNERIKLMSID